MRCLGIYIACYVILIKNIICKVYHHKCKYEWQLSHIHTVLNMNIMAYMVYIQGPFTWCDFDCDLFLTTNGLFEILSCCCNRIVWTLILNPIQPICCNKKITIVIVPCEQPSSVHINAWICVCVASNFNVNVMPEMLMQRIDRIHSFRLRFVAIGTIMFKTTDLDTKCGRAFTTARKEVGAR